MLVAFGTKGDKQWKGGEMTGIEFQNPSPQDQKHKVDKVVDKVLKGSKFNNYGVVNVCQTLKLTV